MLVDVPLLVGRAAPPRPVRTFLREAERRIARYRQHSRIGAFVPSDYTRAYAVLRALDAAGLTGGRLFCEWGSGFGVAACLAAFLEFDACGIEIEAELVAEAQQLADDFDLPVQFIHASFVPRGAERLLRSAGQFSWLSTDAHLPPPELAPDDFDLIFAYPWPDEEDVTARIFARYAAPRALLLTYHGAADFRLRRRAD